MSRGKEDPLHLMTSDDEMFISQLPIRAKQLVGREISEEDVYCKRSSEGSLDLQLPVIIVQG